MEVCGTQHLQYYTCYDKTELYESYSSNKKLYINTLLPYERAVIEISCACDASEPGCCFHYVKRYERSMKITINALMSSKEIADWMYEQSFIIPAHFVSHLSYFKLLCYNIWINSKVFKSF